MVHYGLCASLEEYIRRPGRPEGTAVVPMPCSIVASDDRERLTRRFSSEFPTIAQIKDIYVRLMNYLGVAIGGGEILLDGGGTCTISVPVTVSSWERCRMR